MRKLFADFTAMLKDCAGRPSAKKLSVA
jgi:hypothetical protein